MRFPSLSLESMQCIHSLSLSRIAHSMCTLRPSPSLARPPIAASRSAGQPKYDCSYYRQFCGRSPQWLKRLYLCHAPMDRPTERPREDLASSAVIKTRRIAELATTRTRGGKSGPGQRSTRKRGMRGVRHVSLLSIIRHKERDSPD